MIPSRHLTDSSILRLATSCGYTICNLKYDNKMSPNLPSSQLHREIPSEHRPQQASIQLSLFPYLFKNFTLRLGLELCRTLLTNLLGQHHDSFVWGSLYGNTAHFWHKHCAR